MAIFGNIVLTILWSLVALFVIMFGVLAGKAERGEI